MARNYSERRTACCLILLSATLGLSVHPFYDWTGADQSRPVAMLWQIPLAISAALGIFCIALRWIPIKRGVEFARQPLQFNLRFLLLTTGVIALLLATGIHYPNVFAGIVILAAVLMLIRSWWRSPSQRWSISALLAAMYLPYAGILFNLNAGMHSYFIWFACAPALLPTVIASRFLPQIARDSTGLVMATLFTGLEIAIGLTLIHLGPKRGFVFVVIALVVSLFGAIGLDALMRM